MAQIKSTFKRFNGVDYDTHFFVTTADLIVETDTKKVLTSNERTAISTYLTTFNDDNELLKLDNQGLIPVALIPGGLNYLTINNPTFTGTLTGNTIKTPIAATALTLQKLGLEWEETNETANVTSVRVATTENITLSGTQSIDGVALITSDRVLVKNQNIAGQNGIYTVQTGAWIRVAADSVIGKIVTVGAEGLVNPGKKFIKSSENNVGGAVTLNNNGLTFGAFTNSFTFTSGTDSNGLFPNVGIININNNLLTGLRSPQNNTDAATKLYVDGLVAEGVKPIAPVVAATTANINLSGELTIDGISVTAGQRVLVKNQTGVEDNGIYTVVAGGAWTKVLAESVKGSLVFVEGGTTNNDSKFYATTNLTWILFSRTDTYGVITSGGLQKVGTEFGVAALGITNAMLAGSINPGKISDFIANASVSAVTTWGNGTNAFSISSHINQIASLLGRIKGTYTNLSDSPAITLSDAAAKNRTFAVKLVAAVNVATLSGTQTVSGVALLADNFVILAAQTTPSQNGVYQVKSGAWVKITNSVSGDLAFEAVA